jgi:hypothetical protein
MLDGGHRPRTIWEVADKMSKTLLLSLLMSTPCCLFAADGQARLKVYGDVPGLEPSDQYSLRVRTVGGEWQRAFAFITRCKKAVPGKNKYFSHLSGWSNTYINFEMSGTVEVEISRAGGRPIRKAAAHPRRKARACVVRNGKAYVTIDKPCLIAVDIDGQMDDQDTGRTRNGLYKGAAIRTVTLFANPCIKDRPGIGDRGVRAVRPGEKAPSEGDWKTLYFLPGVHDIGIAFPVHANRSYYIPGDAIVYGTLNNHGDFGDGHHIRVFGYGTLSGARIVSPKLLTSDRKKWRLHDPIYIAGAENTTVEGVTLADSAFHSIMLVSRYKPESPTDIRWVKIFTWRANGDGINPFGNGLVEDCFLRTQDDSTYVNGRGIRRVVYWNDYNGSTFVLSSLPNRKVIVEDCDVIYARAGWHRWSGGRLFNMRGEGSGQCGEGVIFRNIRVEDPRPTLQHFMIAMQGLEPYSSPLERKRGPGNLTGVLFQNIEIAAPSILGEPDILWGAPKAQIVGLTFDNVLIAGKKITDLDHFKHDEHVKDIRFK